MGCLTWGFGKILTSTSTSKLFIWHISIDTRWTHTKIQVCQCYNGIALQCMKWPVTHSPNSTWFWLELVGNCGERLKIIMECTNIQFCERLGNGWQFHLLHWMWCWDSFKQTFQGRTVVAADLLTWGIFWHLIVWPHKFLHIPWCQQYWILSIYQWISARKT